MCIVIFFGFFYYLLKKNLFLQEEELLIAFVSITFFFLLFFFLRKFINRFFFFRYNLIYTIFYFLLYLFCLYLQFIKLILYYFSSIHYFFDNYFLILLNYLNNYFYLFFPWTTWNILSIFLKNSLINLNEILFLEISFFVDSSIRYNINNVLFLDCYLCSKYLPSSIYGGNSIYEDFYENSPFLFFEGEEAFLRWYKICDNYIIRDMVMLQRFFIDPVNRVKEFEEFNGGHAIYSNLVYSELGEEMNFFPHSMSKHASVMSLESVGEGISKSFPSIILNNDNLIEISLERKLEDVLLQSLVINLDCSESSIFTEEEIYLFLNIFYYNNFLTFFMGDLSKEIEFFFDIDNIEISNKNIIDLFQDIYFFYNDFESMEMEEGNNWDIIFSKILKIISFNVFFKNVKDKFLSLVNFELFTKEILINYVNHIYLNEVEFSFINFFKEINFKINFFLEI